MLQRDEVVAAIKQILVNDLFVELPPERIGLDDGLQSVLGLDSVSFAELRMLCERQFGVEIVDADFTPENFRTVGLLTDLVCRLSTSAGKAKTS